MRAMLRDIDGEMTRFDFLLNFEDSGSTLRRLLESFACKVEFIFVGKYCHFHVNLFELNTLQEFYYI